MREKKIKICFCASSGGHFDQIMMLSPLMEKYDSYIITEKTDYRTVVHNRIYYVHQINRKEKDVIISLFYNLIISLHVFIKEQPSIVISTGALATVPTCLLAKLFGRRIVFIESFAKVCSPTKTGKLMYKIADQFYVQWPQMKLIFPDSIFVGGLY